ncbi:hypothetical protein [Lentilactobacillus kosonis]|uniref:Uncharacterized membrane protein n=1 Tax=Lentilactobacillus kosonis TaxID=2810561 RepID=A0A401FMG2_9LACO|nr:hypothetical protein [Lentilactobacillus kosonis]GAY73533.1 uncharacterized membrane protein [Lentilactobacillus kosonis]
MFKKLHVNRILVAGIIGVFGIVPMVGVTASASSTTSVTPTKSLLNKSNKYYRDHRKAIVKKYRLDLASQTALTSKKTASVYVKTSNKYLKQSLNLAMNYWNQSWAGKH